MRNECAQCSRYSFNDLALLDKDLFAAILKRIDPIDNGCLGCFQLVGD